MAGSTTTFGTTGRIGHYTAPATGIYKITAIGASGGDAFGGADGGLAADVSGDVKLTVGEVLNIAVGGKGDDALGGSAGGGGGGSFVVASDGTPLVIAGGGGGGAFDGPNPSLGGNAGGIESNGGGGGAGGGVLGGGGGGGLQEDGQDGASETNNGVVTFGGPGGESFFDGAAGGGDGDDPTGLSANGGFGGGGGGGGDSEGGAGGGGGYSGGNGGNADGTLDATGGTSFDSGTDQHFSVVAQPGNGSVAITLLTSAPVISGTQANQATTDSTPINPFANVMITDTNASSPTQFVSVIPSNPADGALSDPNAASDGGSVANGIYTVRGDAAAVTKAVDGLVFTPTKGQVPQGQTVTTGFLLTDSSSLGFTAIDDNTSVVATSTVSSNLGSGESAGLATRVFDFLRNLSAATSANPDLRQALTDVFASKDALPGLQDFLSSIGGTDNSTSSISLGSEAWTAFDQGHFSLADTLAAYHAVT